MMTIEETLDSAKFLVNEKGEKTAVYLPLEAWDTLVEWIKQNNIEKDKQPQPFKSLGELRGDFWPEYKPVEDFLDAVRQWRQDDLALQTEAN